MYAELDLSDRSPYVHLKIEMKPSSVAPDQAGGSYSQATGRCGCCYIVGVATLILQELLTWTQTELQLLLQRERSG